MLSNKSQYILSKIGIPLFKDYKYSMKSYETIIHFFQKDNILTLHTNSVDEYSEKERNLLESIINAIRGSDEPPTKGNLIVSQKQQLELNQFHCSERIKAILIFSSSIERYERLNAIISPSLHEMIEDSNLKKVLWSKLKSIKAT